MSKSRDRISIHICLYLDVTLSPAVSCANNNSPVLRTENIQNHSAEPGVDSLSSLINTEATHEAAHTPQNLPDTWHENKSGRGASALSQSNTMKGFRRRHIGGPVSPLTDRV